MSAEISDREWTKVMLARAIRNTRIEGKGIPIFEIADVIAKVLSEEEVESLIESLKVVNKKFKEMKNES